MLNKQEALSLTLDAWSTSQNIGVLAINVAYVNDEFKWNMINLASRKLESKHEAEVIMKIVKEVIKTYDLDINTKVMNDLINQLLQCPSNFENL